MSNYLNKSLKELHELLKTKQITPLDLVEESIAKIKENADLNAFITLDLENARKDAIELSKMEVPDDLLFGMPIAIKDNILTKDLKTTCASNMLKDFTPIFSATVVEKVKAHHMIIIGKTNMDEFAMGSTSQTSYFGAPKNPWDKTKIAGGSSGGSASCVAAGLTTLALGSDTGGSIRQPASYTGLVGMKPSYGRVSRYGLVAFASSLDQIGPFSKNVYDNAVLLNALVGKDEHDLTSVDQPFEDFTRDIGKDISGMKIAIPNYFTSSIVSDEILENLVQLEDMLVKNGAIVEHIEMKFLDKAVPLYQIIAMGEASSNLARFDGVRYGFSYPNAKSVDELYEKSRAEGFGDEVKRTIMVGSYLLSGEKATTYYNKALQIRDDMKKEFDRVFENYDFVLGPTTTTVAYNLGEKLNDPSQSFLDDVLVIPVNMAGLPGLNIPTGFNKDHLPIGMHIIANRFEEAKIYHLASFIETMLNLPLIKGEE